MKLYRYEDCKYSGIRVLEFDVLKETPQGYWIAAGFDKKWVSNNGRKRYAYPTPHDALSSYVARKRRQTELLDAQLRTAKLRLQAASDYAGGRCGSFVFPMPRASSFDF